MKTNHIVNALRNTETPAAKLAAWQSRPAVFRLRQLREYLAKPYHAGESLACARQSLLAGQGPELSSPEAESPLLWTREDSREVLEAFPGREFLDHRGWFTDEFQDETLETYAVRLAAFPHLMFYAVKDSCNGDLKVSLEDWEEIDFSECESDYHVDDCIRDTAKEIVRSNESTTQNDAEESVEYARKDRIECDIAENKETLKTLRGKVRALAHELKALCPSPLVSQYPAAAMALRESLSDLLAERRQLFRSNAKLAASL